MKRLRILAVVIATAFTGGACSAAVLDFDGGAADGNKFLSGANWNDAIGSADDVTPGSADRAIINAGFTSNYATTDTTTLGSLVIGADWPVTGATGTAGTLNMSAGKIIVAGGGDSFQLGRACCSGNGTLNLTGSAELEISGTDPVVGTRDVGVLDIGDNAKVYSTTGAMSYWRLGNYGPSFDMSPSLPGGLEGNGLLNVHGNGSFNAHVIFIADNDATGEIHISDNGSVVLTDNLVPRPAGFFPNGSATVRMTGSSATLQAHNLESESAAGEIPTKYQFDADVSGVSAIKLTDAINITNNVLEVNLNGYALPPLGKITLFDGDQALATNRIFGTFSSFTVDGVANPSNYAVVYDQAVGDIELARIPEPAAALLLGLGTVAVSAIRRRSSVD
jgi:hypothetical protein